MDIFLKKPDIPHFLKSVACFIFNIWEYFIFIYFLKSVACFVFFKSVNILFLFIFLKSVFNKYVY